MNFCGLNDNEISVIKDILNDFKITRAAIFGSRVKGNFTEKSDIDIVIFDNINIKDFANLKTEFLESKLPYFVDVVIYDKVSKDFQQEIDKCYKNLL